MLAGRELRRIAAEMPELAIEEVDILSHPRRAWQEGVRMIPTMKIGEQRLSGVLLTGEAIARFIDDQTGTTGKAA